LRDRGREKSESEIEKKKVGAWSKEIGTCEYSTIRRRME